MHIGKEIARQAEHFDICKEWKGDLMTTKDKERLIEMYLKGIDFCIAHDFPPLDFIRKNFAGVMELHCIYVDSYFTLFQPKKVVALGKSTGKVDIGGYGTCEVFARHNAKVLIQASDNAFVMVNVYDNAAVEVQARDKSKVCIHNHNATVNYHTTGEARIKLVNKNGT